MDVVYVILTIELCETCQADHLKNGIGHESFTAVFRTRAEAERFLQGRINQFDHDRFVWCVEQRPFGEDSDPRWRSMIVDVVAAEAQAEKTGSFPAAPPDWPYEWWYAADGRPLIPDDQAPFVLGPSDILAFAGLSEGENGGEPQ